MRIKISWLSYALLCTAYIFVLNYTVLMLVYKNADSLALFGYIAFIYYCLLFIIISIISLPYINKILMSIFIIVASVSGYFMSTFGVYIDYTMIGNALATDKRELDDLLNAYFLAYVFLSAFIPCVFLFVLKINYGTFKANLLKRFLAIILAAALAAGFLIYQAKSIVPFFRVHNEARMLNTPFYQLYSFAKYIKIKNSKPKELKILSKDAKIPKLYKEKKKILVVVVGETARAANYSLGGYKINNTNAYTKLENISYFQASSCATYTARSLPCMFSSSTRANFSDNEYQENAMDILQKLGVKSFWYDNNNGGCQGVCDRLDEVLIHSAKYDDILLEDLKDALRDKAKQKIIVLHLIGSHGPSYYRRYPPDFRRFKPTCDTNKLDSCSLEKIRNTYDNSLLYTDFLLKNMIELLKGQNAYEIALLYYSDHGESLGENGIYLHGMPYMLAPDEQKQIPFIYWSNKALLKNDLKELSHDNLFSSILGFFKVQSKYYDPSLDIFQ